MAGAQIIRGLTTFVYLPGLIRYTGEGPATAWGPAKTSLDAATDLLTNYRNLNDAVGTSDTLQLQDPACRATALASIGELTQR